MNEMCYSSWSNSIWCTHRLVGSCAYDDRFFMIHKKGGHSVFEAQSAEIVWDEHNPAEMSDADIKALVPWSDFTDVTQEQRIELIGYVRMFLEDCWQEQGESE